MTDDLPALCHHSAGWPWRCTLPAGHEGPHQAITAGRIHAEWRTDDDTSISGMPTTIRTMYIVEEATDDN